MKQAKDLFTEMTSVSSMALKDLVIGDEQYAKVRKKDTVDFLDYYYGKYEREIEQHMKKAKLDYDAMVKEILKFK